MARKRNCLTSISANGMAWKPRSWKQNAIWPPGSGKCRKPRLMPNACPWSTPIYKTRKRVSRNCMRAGRNWRKKSPGDIVMPMHRRAALRNLVAMFGAAPWLGAADDPLLEPANVLDFAPLAKAKLDPMAWDYLDGGGEDEASLRDNRAAFQRIILRPRALADVHKIDLSLDLLGQKLENPMLLDPAGGKNRFSTAGVPVAGAPA